MTKVKYEYASFVSDINDLTLRVKDYEPDTILAIARGGLTIAHFLGEKLNLRKVYAINSIHYDESLKLDYIKVFNIPNLTTSKSVLVVDDIVDSGDTLVEILRVLEDEYPEVVFKSASIFYKPTSKIKPDYCVKETHDWIDFFWSVD